MSGTQIIWLVAGVMILFFSIRRLLKVRAVKHYSASDISGLMKNRSIILLDVRTASERNSSSIKGSLHIPLNELRMKTDSLKKYSDKEIVCYCRSGNRSLNAAMILQKNGFKTASLKGGILSWNQSQKH